MGTLDGLHRGSGAAQNEGCSTLTGHLGCHIAGLVTRGLILLVGMLVFLVHHNETQIMDGRKKRRSSTYRHLGFASAQALPLITALPYRESGVQDGHSVAKAAAEAAYGLGG